MTDGRTHWEGCWREPGHHECAVAKVERLSVLNAELVEALSAIVPILEAVRYMACLGKGQWELLERAKAALSRARETGGDS